MGAERVNYLKLFCLCTCLSQQNTSRSYVPEQLWCRIYFFFFFLWGLSRLIKVQSSCLYSSSLWHHKAWVKNVWKGLQLFLLNPDKLPLSWPVLPLSLHNQLTDRGNALNDCLMYSIRSSANPASIFLLLLSRMAAAPPSYCFVAFPPCSKDGLVVFGKNSARPRDEVQEVVYFAAADHEPGSKVEVRVNCYIQTVRNNNYWKKWMLSCFLVRL